MERIVSTIDTARELILAQRLNRSPADDPDQTVAIHTDWFTSKTPADWSAYRDEIWQGSPSG